MQFYETTLKAMHKLLSDCGEQPYADYLADCLVQWREHADTSPFLKGFSQKGIFEHFSFEHTRFPSAESNYWTQQLFGGLTAMAMQLARFENEGKKIDIGFIRKHFGHPAEVISGSRCEDCGTKQICQADIDRYISMQVISTAIADGLEAGNLTRTVEQIMQVTDREIITLRERSRLRAANTGVNVSSGRTPMAVCTKCGGKNIRSCRFLKSLREPKFVELSQ